MVRVSCGIFSLHVKNLGHLVRLTASSRGNTFLPIYVTLWDAQNRSHFISMDLANMSSLLVCPVLDAVSLNAIIETWDCYNIMVCFILSSVKQYPFVQRFGALFVEKGIVFQNSAARATF